MGTVDEYFAGLDPSRRAAFERVRRIAMEMVPDAEQGTSYGMAALRYHGKPLVCFLAAKGHLSVFPCSGKVVDAVSDQLEGYELSKGTIRFTAEHPLPETAVRNMIEYRLEEISPRG
jgi:uncharacterized protein YdhG (YjbR/CyaY superfamily)